MQHKFELVNPAVSKVARVIDVSHNADFVSVSGCLRINPLKAQSAKFVSGHFKITKVIREFES